MFCFCRHCFAFIIGVLVSTMGFRSLVAFFAFGDDVLLLPSLFCFYHWRFGFDNGFLFFGGIFAFCDDVLLLPSLFCFYHWRFGFDNGFLFFGGQIFAFCAVLLEA